MLEVSQRTKEALGVVHYLGMFLLLGWSGLLFLTYLLFTRFYWVSLIYAAWLYYDYDTPSKATRKSWRISTLPVFLWLKDYFSMTLHKRAELDPAYNYMFVQHPHGTFVFGGFIQAASELTGFQDMFPGIKKYLLVLNGWFLLPFIRDYIMGGGIGAVSADSINYKLTRLGPGHSVWILPGGAAEAVMATPGDVHVILSNRFGFIREAIRAGARLVPVLSFGECDVFTQTQVKPGSLMAKAQDIFKRVTGLGWLMLENWIPRRVPIDTVVGVPIVLPKIENPSRDEVAKWHAVYVEQLKEFYETEKGNFGHADRKLIIH